MEPVTIHHPVTSLSEVFFLMGWTGVATLIWYGVMGARQQLTREAVTSVLGRRASAAEMQAAPVSAGQMACLRKFHFSWPTFLLNCVPMLMFVLLGVVCWLLLDAGYLLFPWLTMLVAAANFAGIHVVYLTRRRLIRRLMQGEAA